MSHSAQIDKSSQVKNYTQKTKTVKLKLLSLAKLNQLTYDQYI